MYKLLIEAQIETKSHDRRPYQYTNLCYLFHYIEKVLFPKSRIKHMYMQNFVNIRFKQQQQQKVEKHC